MKIKYIFLFCFLFFSIELKTGLQESVNNICKLADSQFVARVSFLPNEKFEEQYVDEVKRIFVEEWQKQFGAKNNEELYQFLKKVHVEFTKEKIGISGGYYESGERIPASKNIKCLGVVVSDEHIKVWVRESPHRISKTSLVHELVHLSLRYQNRHSDEDVNKLYDPDHLGDKYNGWTKEHSNFIRKINELLLTRGH